MTPASNCGTSAHSLTLENTVNHLINIGEASFSTKLTQGEEQNKGKPTELLASWDDIRNCHVKWYVKPTQSFNFSSAY